jgi:hypothetical protein
MEVVTTTVSFIILLFRALHLGTRVIRVHAYHSEIDDPVKGSSRVVVLTIATSSKLPLLDQLVIVVKAFSQLVEATCILP